MSDMAVFFMILSVIAFAGLVWTYYSQKHSKHSKHSH